MARSGAARLGLAGCGLLLAIGFAILGTWQLHRRAWKHDLIARIERRLAAVPAPAPDTATWARINRADDEYRRIRVTGRFLTGGDTLVFASTRLGPGYWLMTPFRDARGFTLLVNRGFVPSRRLTIVPPEGQLTVSGLLRLTEPGGDLLRSNAPADDRWYSRDIAAIARKRGLGRIAPFFIDAEAPAELGHYPRGGLTIVRFADNHLVYALTWYALALLAILAAGLVIRQRPN